MTAVSGEQFRNSTGASHRARFAGAPCPPPRRRQGEQGPEISYDCAASADRRRPARRIRRSSSVDSCREPCRTIRCRCLRSESGERRPGGSGRGTFDGFLRTAPASCPQPAHIKSPRFYGVSDIGLEQQGSLLRRKTAKTTQKTSNLMCAGQGLMGSMAPP